MSNQTNSNICEALAEAGGGRVLCTQPRRISATSVAERVALERPPPAEQHDEYNKDLSPKHGHSKGHAV